MSRNKEFIFSDIKKVVMTFLNEGESVDSFYTKFIPLWREYRGAEENSVSIEQRREISDLAESYFSGAISKEEYNRKTAILESDRSEVDSRLEHINNIHSVGSIYSSSPVSEHEIDESKLREIIRSAALSLNVDCAEQNYSIQRLVDTIDEDPFRWQNITLESILSLPTLSEKDNTKYVEFFFYPVLGNIDDRKIGRPYYRVYGAIDTPYTTIYEPVEDSFFDEISNGSDYLGSFSLGDMSLQEYEEKRAEIYRMTSKIISLYWNDLSHTTSSSSSLTKEYKKLFMELVFPPLLSAYRKFNPSFMNWITDSK